MSDKSIPTIPVKKSDGSVVKMTLDEFREYKAQKSPSPEATVSDDFLDPHTQQGTTVLPHQVVTPDIAPQTEPIVQNEVVVPEEALPEHNLPMVEETMALSSDTPTIVGETMHDLQNDSVATLPVQEFTSPLEEETEDVDSTLHAPVSDSSEALTSEVISSLKFSLNDELQSRLHSLVLSRIKDIRTNSQVEQYALLGAGAGGLGLTDSQTSKLMNALQDVLVKRPVAPSLPSAQALLQPTGESSQIVVEQPSAPVPQVTPIVVTPSMVPTEKKVDGQKILNSLIAEDKIQAELKTKLQSGSPTSINVTRIDTGKISVQDVVVKSRSVGPIDEMMNFSLVDLRRLGANAKASADNLIQKFNVLKAESYLLFLQGKSAWLRSPLYISYLEVLEKSLNTNKPVSSVLGLQKDELHLDEFQELIRVSQSLNI